MKILYFAVEVAIITRKTREKIAIFLPTYSSNILQISSESRNSMTKKKFNDQKLNIDLSLNHDLHILDFVNFV